MNLKGKNEVTGEMTYKGKVRVQIDIVTKQEALVSPVGKGREMPNHSPYMKPPEGRIEMSLNPVKMMK